VAGFIAKVEVADNQAVRAGDLLVKLDDRDVRAALAKAVAAVEGQQATLVNLEATRRLQQALIAQAQAGVAAADAESVRAHDDQVRYRRLAADNVASVQIGQKADAEYEQALAARRALARRARGSASPARRHRCAEAAGRGRARRGHCRPRRRRA
jgi:membrane fusion protein (multidrug efflux system)